MATVTLRSGPKVRILLGKGGVGKTLVSSALARALADQGAQTLLVELDGRPEIARHFDLEGPLPQADTLLYQSSAGGSVIGRHVAADDALLNYLDGHGMKSVSRRLHKSGLVDLIAGSIPGFRDVLVLGQVKQFANRDDIDSVVVDGPATGHALTLLTSPIGLARVARAGPVKEQAEEVSVLLRDKNCCGIVLVTTPEELPISETIEAAFRIEDEADVALEFVVANRVHADLAQEALEQLSAIEAELGNPALTVQLREAFAFAFARCEAERPELERLRRELPLPLWILPALDAVSAETEMVAHLSQILGAIKTPVEPA